MPHHDSLYAASLDERRNFAAERRMPKHNHPRDPIPEVRGVEKLTVGHHKVGAEVRATRHLSDERCTKLTRDLLGASTSTCSRDNNCRRRRTQGESGRSAGRLMSGVLDHGIEIAEEIREHGLAMSCRFWGDIVFGGLPHERCRKGLIEREVEVNGAINRGDRLPSKLRRSIHLADSTRWRFDIPGLMHGSAENSGLLSGLIRANAPQGIGPVSANNDQRDRRMVGFKHCRMQVRNSCARGRHDDNRRPRFDSKAEREKSCHSLVNAHAQSKQALLLKLGGSERNCLRTRSGAQHYVSNAETNELFEKGYRKIGGGRVSWSYRHRRDLLVPVRGGECAHLVLLWHA